MHFDQFGDLISDQFRVHCAYREPGIGRRGNRIENRFQLLRRDGIEDVA